MYKKGEQIIKKTIKADSNCDSRVRKWKGVEDASPTNPKKGRSGKRRTKI